MPKVAARWKDLGQELKIPDYHLNTIEANNVHYSSHCEKCCQDMFRKWIQSTVSPSWDILQNAIDSLPRISDDGSNKSKTISCSCIIRNLCLH